VSGFLPGLLHAPDGRAAITADIHHVLRAEHHAAHTVAACGARQRVQPILPALDRAIGKRRGSGCRGGSGSMPASRPG
jgi:hypothetical protein